VNLWQVNKIFIPHVLRDNNPDDPANPVKTNPRRTLTKYAREVSTLAQTDSEAVRMRQHGAQEEEAAKASPEGNRMGLVLTLQLPVLVLSQHIFSALFASLR
jgi:hypothetical protein